ncbi:MAG: energy-coupling factor ABC transporter ATP-binding protein [Propionibacteriaceae bacterium]|jgi:biotin transport system ATP-binding protein|nr:energy-coupling factor ABC transporter ATP-binding protein [Propionibacteriaceae bacterium]
MIQFDSVSHRYGDREVLRDVSLHLDEPRIGIIGGNGSGKSTLARLCNGLVRPTAGRVSVDGYDTVRDLAIVRTLVGFVFQDPDLQIIMPTVAEDLAFSLRPARLPKAEVEARVMDWLERYGLASHRDHGAHLLSGGQKQLLAIAAILITGPRIVIFDEPTTLLDLANKRRVMQVIRDLTQPVIVVTHDLDSLTDFDRVIVLHQGGVVADDRPETALPFYRDLIDAEADRA